MTYKKALHPYPSFVRLRLHPDLASASKFMDTSECGLTALLEDGTISVDISLPIAMRQGLLNVIVHEAVHVCQFLQDYIQTTLDDETQAYMTADIASWAFSKATTFASSLG